MSRILNEGKIARASFCSIEIEGEKCADKVKENSGGDVRGVRIDKSEKPSGLCISCDGEAKHIVYIARSY